ncbi:MAG TPA: ester cyclase [Actinomycetes bacterium]|nr:ester cyclase [Actinomycetes bacterium]
MQDVRSLIERHYRNLSTGDVAAEDALFSPDVVTVEPAAGTIQGLDAFKAYVQAFRTAFPDGQHRLTSIVESGSLVAAEGTFTGTQQGPLVGAGGELPPTGRQVEFSFADFFEVEGGRIVKHRLYYDQVTFRTQLGLMPGPT